MRLPLRAPSAVDEGVGIARNPADAPLPLSELARAAREPDATFIQPPWPHTTAQQSGRALMLAAFLIGALLRLPLIFGQQGILNSDEAFTGLIARELSDGRLYWIFPAQAYQGTLEAFVAAAVTPLFGPSAPLLKLVSAAFWLASALLLDLAARRISGSRPGVVFTLVWLWSSSMVLLSATSLVGYGSGLLFCSLGYWAWSRAESSHPTWLWMVIAGIGFGAATWQQPTFLPTAVIFGLGTLLVPGLRAVRCLAALAGGMLVGVSPLIAFNAANRWIGLESPPQPDYTFFDRVRLTLTDLLPRSVGARLRNGEWTLGAAVAAITIAAMVVAFVWVAVHMWHQRPLMRPLILLAAINVPAVAAFSTSWYTVDARYAVSFVPVLAIIVGTAMSLLAQRFGARIVAPTLTGLAIVGLVVPLYREGSFAAGTPNKDVGVLVDQIRSTGFHCAVGDYWSTHRVDYLADGEFHASAAPPYPVRLPRLYEQIIDEPGRYVLLAPVGSALDQQYTADAGEDWQRSEVAGTAVFSPVAPAPPSPDGLC